MAVSRNSAVRVRVRAMVQAAKERRKEKKRRMNGRLGGGKRVEGIPLPLELVIAILGRLPVRDLLRAGAVCKAWKREVNSPEFVREHYARSGGCMDAPTVALVSDMEMQLPVAFNTELKRWVRVPALFFEGERCCLVAQAKGLYVHAVQLCLPKFETGDGHLEKTQLVVSNPVTGATKWLPPMLRNTSLGCSEAQIVHLSISEEGAAYRITCIDADEQCVEVYDSRLGSWTAFHAPSVTTSMDLVDIGLVPGVVLLGNAYSVSVNDAGDLAIVSFNLEDRKWRLVYDFEAAAAARYPATAYHTMQLATCDEKLIVVLLKYKEGGGGAVFALDMERNLLVYETSLPRRLVSRLVCFGGHSVCSILGREHHLCSLDPENGSIVAYDFSTKRWEEWPSSPIPYLSRSHTTQLVDLQFGLLPVNGIDNSQSNLCAVQNSCSLQLATR